MSLVIPTLVKLGLVIRGIVSVGLVGDNPESDTCSLYYLDPTAPDSLELVTAFTGNVKLIFATFNGDTGLADPFKGTNPVNSPEEARTDSSKLIWNQVEANVSGITEICGTDFDGVFASIGLNDTWYRIDLKGDYSYLLPGTNNGIQLDTPVDLTGDWYIEFRVFIPDTPTSNEAVVSTDSGSFVVYLTPAMRCTAQVPLAAGGNEYVGADVELGWNSIRLSMIDGLCTMTTQIDNSNRAFAAADTTVGFVGSWNGSLRFAGAVKDLDISNINFFPLNDLSEIVVDTLQGNTATILGYDETAWGVR